MPSQRPADSHGTITRKIQLEFEHRVVFTRAVFDPANPALASSLRATPDGIGHPAKALVFLDRALAGADPDLASRVVNYFLAQGGGVTLAAAPISLPGGEACKNDWRLVESIWRAIHEAGLCRHSYVIAVGGGAVLDLVGFASATAHRGIRHLRLPTTTLSQADGGVGVKNGVNYFRSKNWIGTFAVPHAIICDLDFLRCLPPRDRRAGLIEAIKVGLIRDGAFFEALEARCERLANLDETALEFAIRRSAELHMDHIALGGDPFELGSARPLDFGHWAAHKLEQLTDFRLSHGEAVAIGMAVDLLYARNRGMLAAATCDRILRLITRIGFPIYAPEMLSKTGGQLALVHGLEEFRAHLGGQLTITLVTGIGHAVEVHEIDTSVLPGILEELRQAAQAESPAEQATRSSLSSGRES